MLGAVDRPALALVLVAPVRLTLRNAREVEVEVRREPRRPRGAGEDDPQDVRVLVVADDRAPEEKLGRRPRREPIPRVRRTVTETGSGTRTCLLQPGAGVAELLLERELVVTRGLDPHEQAVEGGDVTADSVAAALERLHERRPRAGERIEHRPARPDVPP